MTNVTYRDITLGQEAFDYIYEDCMSVGKTLRSLVREYTSFEKGRVWTRLPELVTEEQAKGQIRWGVLLEPPCDHHVITQDEKGNASRWVPKPTTNAMLAERMSEYLSQRDNHVCVFEHALALASDPWLRGIGNVAIYGDSVYLVLFSEDAENHELVQNTIMGVGGAHFFFSIMSSMTDHQKRELRKRHEIAFDTMISLAGCFDEAVFGAYDGEGYVFWNRSIPST